MRALLLGLVSLPLAIVAFSCGGTSSSGFGDSGTGGSAGSGGGAGFAGSGGSGGTGTGGAGGSGSGGSGGVNLNKDSGGPDGGVTTTITVYANTDTELFSMDSMSMVVNDVGTFSGTSGKSGDTTVTDVAVDAEGDVYVNTETVVYKATLPATTPGTVTLTAVATIAGSASNSFYALGFAPPGFLGSGETLVGGDGNGVLWSIDTSSGATKNLGNFGPVPGGGGNYFALSGDVFFYTDSKGNPTGIATIRSCPPAGSHGYCDETNDFLAGIDMTALATAYTSGKPAASLLAGIYGGSGTSTGPGTGYGRIYGLAAWEGNVYGFSRVGSSGSPPPYLLNINTSTGAGSIVSMSFPFTMSGWSGAGATSKSVVKIPPPPQPPK